VRDTSEVTANRLTRLAFWRLRLVVSRARPPVRFGGFERYFVLGTTAHPIRVPLTTVPHRAPAKGVYPQAGRPGLRPLGWRRLGDLNAALIRHSDVAGHRRRAQHQPERTFQCSCTFNARNWQSSSSSPAHFCECTIHGRCPSIQGCENALLIVLSIRRSQLRE